jgi:DNA topoisomerase-1
MADAKIEKTVAEIEATGKTDTVILTATGEVLKFDGFLKVYLEGTDDEEGESSENKNMLPPIQEGQILNLAQMIAKETFARPKPRFTEASLVKELEKRGIGRPSTYAPTISTIQDRGYIKLDSREASQRKVRLLTLEKSEIKAEEIVTDFLVKYFGNIVDYDFTKKVEAEFDLVAEGKMPWGEMLEEFYGPFHKLVEDSGGISREEANQSRELGVDPKSGKPVIARLGRFGAMIQIGTRDDEEKPQFASIPEGETIESISLETALEQFAFPKILGKDAEGEDVTVNLGRFGPYIKAGKTNASLKKKSMDEEGNTIRGDEPGTITLERALELLAEKKEADKNRFIADWPEEKIQILRGPYGIYIKHDKRNVKIPKSVNNPEKLTLEECQKIIEEAPATRGRRGRR